MTGLLFELGPCSIANDGKNVTFNKHSWNSDANIIFLDQPVNVGFSYADNGKTVSTSSAVGKDVYAFLELFLNRFPEYSKAPFHLAGESYGGTYTPNIAKVIFEANQELSLTQKPNLKHINLASIVIANGLTEPYTQFGSIPEQVCNGPYPVFDPNGRECQRLKLSTSVCQRLIEGCYKFTSRLTCAPAHMYCFNQVFGVLIGETKCFSIFVFQPSEFTESGRNPYDARRKCDRKEDGDLCYKEMLWVGEWMNDPSNKLELGVDPSRRFDSCNDQTNSAFAYNGDGVHNSALLLPELLNAGVKLLVYNGNAGKFLFYLILPVIF